MRRTAIVIATVLALIVLVSPALLFGEAVTPFGLLMVAAVSVVSGLAMTWWGIGRTRFVGSILLVTGLVLSVIVLVAVGMRVGP